MEGRAVAITGMGLATPLGVGVERNWGNLKELKTGISRSAGEQLPHFMQYLGVVQEHEFPPDLPHKLQSQSKFLNRGSFLGFLAAREAMGQAALPPEEVPPDRKALYIASGDLTMVGYDFLYPAVKDALCSTGMQTDCGKLNQSTLDKVNPFFLLESISNNLFSFLSAFLEFMGPSTSLASHSPSGGNALELAARSISSGKAEIAMAVGCGNWITEIPLLEMNGLGVLSQCREGSRSFRPFDRKRDGFIPGEGGAALFLETADRAKQRGAQIWGIIKGFGNAAEFSTDRSLGVPDRVSEITIREALEDAGCDPDDLSFICPHGSSTQKGDRSELRSIVSSLGGSAPGIPVCGLKPYTGHLGAASDIAETIFGIRATAEGLVPATLNFTESEKEFRNLRISSSHQASRKGHFLSVSYGIGGQSSSVIVQVCP